MSIKVTVVSNPIDKATWIVHEVESLVELFKKLEWKTFPESARIYNGEIADSNDVTPGDEEGANRLEQMAGPFHIVIRPGVAALPYIFAVVVAIAAVALAPKPPTVNNRNQTSGSANNDLSNRVNRSRLNGRIPDIFGQVRSTPDLIALSYSVFENNREVEYSFMCIGRGEFDISDIRDGETLCRDIPGTTVQIFPPYKSPLKGDSPTVVVGQERSIPVVRAFRSNGVNGQVLRPPNAVSLTGTENIRFVYPNIIEATSASNIDFTQSFVDGDIVDLSDAVLTPSDTFAETLTVLADRVRVYQYLGSNTKVNGSHYTYFDAAGGSLLIRIRPDKGETPNAYANTFYPGAEFHLQQNSIKGWAKDNHPTINLTGDYEVESAEYKCYSESDFSVEVQPSSFAAGNFGLRFYLVVKLVDPSSVNSHWNWLNKNAEQDSYKEAAEVNLTATHIGLETNLDLDLGGTYTVLSVEKNRIVLNNPSGVNADWEDADFADIGATPFISPTIESSEAGRWVGPFVLSDFSLQELICNFVASNGLYKDDGTNQFAVSVSIEIEVTPIDDADEPRGDPETFTLTLTGSKTIKEAVCSTIYCRPGGFDSRCKVRARRVSEHDDEFEGQVIDEVRWKDLYSFSYMSDLEFGNVTTIQSVVYATASALAVKDRKLNMLVTRKLPARIGDTNAFTDDALVATKSGADIFIALSRDKYIGNRSVSELNIPNIYDTVAEIADYFGHNNPTEICATLDDDTISYEETANAFARAMHCEAYRRGNIINLSFEKDTVDSKLLFNHRNKLPGTEDRTVSFNNQNDNDGIEFAYINPANDAPLSLFLPLNYAAINPKKIESIGVRNHLQAYFLAYRAWNKIRFQRLVAQFEATQEANLLIRSDRILNTDSTRYGAQDGEVIAVDSLELTLSKPVDLSAFTVAAIFLQHTDGTVQPIEITAGDASNKVILGEAPSQPLAIDPEGYTRTGFVIVGDNNTRGLPFLVTEKETLSRMTSKVTAINFDSRYYTNDYDLINNVIDENALGPRGGYTPGEGQPYDDEQDFGEEGQVLLLHFDERYATEPDENIEYDNSTHPIIDSSALNLPVLVDFSGAGGSIYNSTRAFLFGQSSGSAFVGLGHAGKVEDVPFTLSFGQKFSVESRVYINSDWITNTRRGLIFANADYTYRLELSGSGAHYFKFITPDFTLTSDTAYPIEDAWQHVAICFDGTVLRMFQAGNLVAELDLVDEGFELDWGDHGTPGNQTFKFLTTSGATEAELFMQELRIVTGTAEFTEDFEPPAVPYT